MKPAEDEVDSLDLRSVSDASSCMSRDIGDVEVAAELGAKTGAAPRTEQAVWGVGSA